MKQSLFVLLLLLLSIPKYSNATIRFMCREFSPNSTPCGRNRQSNFPSQWLGSSTRHLPKISANLDELQEWVLLMNSTSASKSIANYELSISSFSSGLYCAQFAALYADSCLYSSQIDCHVNFQFKDNSNILNSSRNLHYREGEWSLLSYEFDIKNNEFYMKPVLIGTIEHAKKSIVFQSPYIAIKYIQIIDGKCPNRIGTRVTFWIMIMVIFSLLTTYVFIHITLAGIINFYQSRKAKAVCTILKP